VTVEFDSRRVNGQKDAGQESVSLRSSAKVRKEISPKENCRTGRNEQVRHNEAYLLNLHRHLSSHWSHPAPSISAPPRLEERGKTQMKNNRIVKLD